MILRWRYRMGDRLCRWGWHKEKITGSEGRIHFVICRRCGATNDRNYYPDSERMD